LVLVVGMAACGSGKSSAKPTRSPSVTPSATASLSATGAAERDALAAYRGMWDSFVEAAKTSDADFPALRTYASDDALKLIVGALATNRHENKVILGDLRVDPKVTSATPPEAPADVAVLDCVNDEKWLVYNASGGLVNDKPGGRHQTTATVKRGSSGWKVSRFVIGDQSC
jgi:hypothetical protein